MLSDYSVLTQADQVPYLLIGPWRHVDQGVIAASVADTIAWLRAHLLGDHGLLRAAPVRIFVGGAGEWRDLPAWPPPSQPQCWHLQAGRGLDPSPPGRAGPDSYVYDPADPTPSVGGPADHAGDAQPDNRELEARPDVLCYTSEPLRADIEVVGNVAADLYVRSSREHTDFFARLCDVDQAGRSVNICDALVRLAPGAPPPAADGVISIRIELWPTAHRFAAGHRIRLQVSSGAHPRYSRNPGTGDPLATATALVAAHQDVYHDPDHPSAISLPATS